MNYALKYIITSYLEQSLKKGIFLNLINPNFRNERKIDDENWHNRPSYYYLGIKRAVSINPHF